MYYEYKKLPQFINAFIANGGAFSLGILLSWSAVAGPFLISINNKKFVVNDFSFSFVVAVMPLGGAFSSIFMGWLRNKVGTKIVLFVSGLVMIGGWALHIYALNLNMLLAGRFLTGISAGGFCNVIPLYIGEIASMEIRGVLLSTFQLSVSFGSLSVFVLGYYLSLPAIQWIFAGVAVFQSLAFLFLTESPSFLVGKSKIKDAEKSMKKLRGKNFDINEEMDEIKKVNRQMIRENQTFKETFADKANQRATIIMSGIWFFFQMTGINAIFFYIIEIFEETTLTIDATLASIIVSILPIIGTIISGTLIERFGRKVLLLYGVFFMTFSLIALGIYFHLLEISSLYVIHLEYLPIISMGVFVTSFAIGLGPISYILHGELFSNQAKIYAAPLGQIISFLSSFSIAIIVIALKKFLGEASTFYVFAVLCELSIIFIVMLVKETKGKTLQEIQEMLKYPSMFDLEF